MKKGVLCQYCIPIENSNDIQCQKTGEIIPGYKCGVSVCENHKFKPEVVVTIDVGRCDECPFVTTERTPNAGFAFDYFCTACKNKYTGKLKRITSYVEWDSEIPPVPDWCPFRKKV